LELSGAFSKPLFWPAEISIYVTLYFLMKCYSKLKNSSNLSGIIKTTTAISTKAFSNVKRMAERRKQKVNI